MSALDLLKKQSLWNTGAAAIVENIAPVQSSGGTSARNTRNNDPRIPAAPQPNNNVSVTIDPPPTVRPPNIFEFLFPPLALLNIGLAGGGLPTADTLPDVTIEGPPDVLTDFLKTNPIITYETPPAADPLAGLGTTVDLIVKFLPILLIVGLFTSIKKVF